jgi:hypothetical protein
MTFTVFVEEGAPGRGGSDVTVPPLARASLLTAVASVLAVPPSAVALTSLSHGCARTATATSTTSSKHHPAVPLVASSPGVFSPTMNTGTSNATSTASGDRHWHTSAPVPPQPQPPQSNPLVPLPVAAPESKGQGWRSPGPHPHSQAQAQPEAASGSWGRPGHRHRPRARLASARRNNGAHWSQVSDVLGRPTVPTKRQPIAPHWQTLAPAQYPQPIHVNASGGVDSSTCGDLASPCATFSFAINGRANLVQPLSAVVSVVLGPGVFGPTNRNCGANATRPVNITGAGSTSTVIDCGGLSRALVASSSPVRIVGVTVTGGVVDVSQTCGDGNDVSFDAPGGGGVAIMWPPSLSNALAEFVDVTFTNNSVLGLVSEPDGSACPEFGGGGLYLAGGGSGTAVTMEGCSFRLNGVNVLVNTSVWFTLSFGNGGGAYIAVGDRSTGLQSESTLTDVTVVVNNSAAHSNSVALVGGGIFASVYGFYGGDVSGTSIMVSNVTATDNLCTEGGCILPK